VRRHGAAQAEELGFIQTLPGFRGHVVFEKARGPSSDDLVMLAAWESPQAVENAVAAVQAYFQRVGFDGPREMARWGVKAELGIYTLSPEAQFVRP
jgi:hypothetical protein